MGDCETPKNEIRNELATPVRPVGDTTPSTSSRATPHRNVFEELRERGRIERAEHREAISSSFFALQAAASECKAAEASPTCSTSSPQVISHIVDASSPFSDWPSTAE